MPKLIAVNTIVRKVGDKFEQIDPGAEFDATDTEAESLFGQSAVTLAPIPEVASEPIPEVAPTPVVSVTKKGKGNDTAGNGSDLV